MRHFVIKPLLLLGFVGIFLAVPFLAGYEIRKITDNAQILEDLGADQVFVFFGFAACSDICPITLATFGRALEQDSGSDSAFLFVDIDPTSSVSLAQDYATAFHPQIHSLATSSRGYQALLSSLGEQTQISGSAIRHAGNVYVLRNNRPDWVVTQVIPPDKVTAAALTALMALE
ncbi:hypothetical protein CHH28_01020 [Bacterioplanes sanyensis]|uniref:SCO family protein n=1 Tax=Bacterioplanes sanyensis TaxID=1249553 RepID=A0A222FF15_9GAMM|nr:SCO family protein [Bacterioplanes sanyensis]ASP37350.1 hypothetical protein CHH28_01020 [Bacterioplanes sanyensis]